MEIENFTPAGTGAKSTEYSVISQLFSGAGSYQLSANQAYWLYSVCDTVGSAVDLVAWVIQQLTPVLRETKTGEYLRDHPMYELFKNPGMKTNGELFKYNLAKNYLISGYVCPVLEGNVKYEPAGMYVLDSDCVTRVQANDGWLGEIVGSATYDHNVYTRQTIPKRKMWVYQAQSKLRETIQIANNIKGKIYGESVLTRVHYQALIKYYGSIHNSNIVKNGSRPSGLWRPKEALSQSNYEAFKNEIKEKFTGPMNTGKNVIAPAPMEYENFLLNPRDMDFINLIENSRKEIYSQYQIPLALTTTEAMTMNNYENSVYSLYDMAALPRAKFLYSVLGQFILPRYKNSEGLELVINEKEIPALKERLYKRMGLMQKTYTFSDNEMRTEGGYEGIGTEGDAIYKPMNLLDSGQVDDYVLDNITRETNENNDEQDIGVEPVE